MRVYLFVFDRFFYLIRGDTTASRVTGCQKYCACSVAKGTMLLAVHVDAIVM